LTLIARVADGFELPTETRTNRIDPEWIARGFASLIDGQDERVGGSLGGYGYGVWKDSRGRTSGPGGTYAGYE
jgi:hypothetical protein